MAITKKLGPKTRLYLASRNYKADDRLAVQVAAKLLYDAVLPMLEEPIARAVELTKKAYSDAEKDLKNLPEVLEKKAAEDISKRVEKIKTALQNLPHLKGNPGKDAEPLKPGVDYLTKEQTEKHIKDLSSLVFTKEQTEKLIGEAMSDLFNNIERLNLSEEATKKLQKGILEALPIADIARGLEQLPEKAKLSYEKGLKDKPNIPTGEHKQRTLHRGGGTTTSFQTYYADLSNLCDGNTRVFSIPTNVRVIDVGCTDAPNGRYHPGVDWTAVGTILTLSNDVAAPTEGATLYVLYVA